MVGGWIILVGTGIIFTGLWTLLSGKSRLVSSSRADGIRKNRAVVHIQKRALFNVRMQLNNMVPASVNETVGQSAR